jgi:hypothetical protein
LTGHTVYKRDLNYVADTCRVAQEGTRTLPSHNAVTIDHLRSGFVQGKTTAMHARSTVDMNISPLASTHRRRTFDPCAARHVFDWSLACTFVCSTHASHTIGE